MTYFKGKKFHPSEGPYSNLLTQESKKVGTPQNKKDAFFKTVLYLLPIQNYMKQSNFKNLVKITGPFLCTFGNNTELGSAEG
jgi:hypothetical protein